jgi:hypothetical protein
MVHRSQRKLLVEVTREQRGGEEYGDTYGVEGTALLPAKEAAQKNSWRGIKV